MMFSLMRLSLNDGLNLLYDVLVDSLVNLGSVDRSGVSLVSNISLILELKLILVLCSGGIINILSTFTLNDGSGVLVVSSASLFVKDGLNLLMDFSLVTGALNDRGDFVMGV